MANWKKISIDLLAFIIIIFVIPALCTKRTKNTIANVENTTEEQKWKKYDYTKFATIKLYHTKTDTVEELPIDEYLCGVVSAEMPASYEIEALKAQAVAARTYTIYQMANSKGKHKEKNANMCDDSTCCQAWISKDERLERWEEKDRQNYWGKIQTAVNSTAGKIITYNNEPIDAFFHSNSGGKTESVSNVWGGTDLPYLQSVETAGEDGYSQFSSEITISKKDLIEKLKKEYKDIKINFEDSEPIKILEFNESRESKNCKVWKYRNCRYKN